MTNIVTNIAGSLTAGQLGQQQAASAEQDGVENYKSQMTREMQARVQQLQEEVAQTEQDTESKRIGQDEEQAERRRRRRRQQQQRDQKEVIASAQDTVEVHTDDGQPATDSPPPLASRKPPPQHRIDISV